MTPSTRSGVKGARIAFLACLSLLYVFFLPSASFAHLAARLRVAECADHHELDAWIGQWDVYRGAEKAGTQRVQRMIDGCAIVAEWTGVQGDRGLGTFSYDEAARGWLQLWVSNNKPHPGRPIVRRQDPAFEGRGIRMVHANDPFARAGAIDRVTTTPLAPDRIRQVLESSRDGGQTWTTVFDVEHRKVR
jgi:hypothetical protein